MLPEHQRVLIGQLADLRARGWTFIAVYDQSEPPLLDAILGTRVRGLLADTLHVYSDTEAQACRLRCGSRRPVVLWRYAGTLADTIAGLNELPPVDLWLPSGGRCST